LFSDREKHSTSTDEVAHFPYCTVQADKQCTRDDGVPDAYLFDFPDVANRRDVQIIETVAGIDSETEFARHDRCLADSLQLLRGLRFCPRVGVFARVYFNEISLNVSSRIDLRRDRVNEEADVNLMAMKLLEW
jgi:hypothetical protein